MRKFLIAAALFLAILIIAAVVVHRIYAPTVRTIVREHLEAYLSQCFQSTVEFADLDISVHSRVHVAVKDLILRHHGRTDVPPLVSLHQVSFDIPVRSLFHPSPEISTVRVAGLKIVIPPRFPGSPPMIKGTDTDLAQKYSVVLGEIDADDAVLVMLPRDPNKAPHEFDIHRLVLRDVGFSRPAHFHAMLSNPVPKGEIDSTGDFGPWDGENPAATPVDAAFTFDQADLGTIKGIKGILSSKGRFSGPLDYLSVQGYTDTPDFALRTSNNPVALHTDYTAIVDGTNGDTILKNVTAHFLNSTIVARGAVVDENKSMKGRTIDLDAVSQGARIEDLLRLAVKSDEPLMAGVARLKTKILIPEEDRDMVDRLKLDGHFGVEEMHFANPSTEGKVDALSRRAQGHPKDLSLGSDATALKGRFKLDNAVISFSDLAFGVTGADIQLTGTYGMDTGELDFHGKLIMQAKLSQTTTGVKSFFLKAVDPFFKGKQGGSELPIKITGTKEHPQFGLDLHDKQPHDADKTGARIARPAPTPAAPGH